jgi:hypothetical protein
MKFALNMCKIKLVGTLIEVMGNEEKLGTPITASLLLCIGLELNQV